MDDIYQYGFWNVTQDDRTMDVIVKFGIGIGIVTGAGVGIIDKVLKKLVFHIPILHQHEHFPSLWNFN